MSTSVAEDNTSAQNQETENQSNSAQGDDLDTLLESFGSEFDEATKQPETSKQTKSGQDPKLDFLYQKEITRDINEAIGIVKDGLGEVELSDRFIKGYLNELAMEKPVFKNAFDNRDANPGAWKKALKAATNEMQKEFKMPDQKLNADRKAMESAVAGTKSATNDEMTQDEYNKKLNTMTDVEFNRWKQTGEFPK